MAGSGGKRGALKLLVCRVGTRLCGLPLEQVVETMRPVPVEPLAHLPAFIAGVALIRGQPTPVLLAYRLLGSERQRLDAERYVTLRLGTRRVALAVDSVLGVRQVELSQLQTLPALLREPRNDLVLALGRLDRELLLVLEESRLVPHEVWQSLGAKGSSS